MNYLRPPTIMPHSAVSVQQAVANAPTLARLTELARESQERLLAITPLLPPALRAAIQAGSIEEGQWCVLVNNSAVAAKLRQLQPNLLATLRAQGWHVSAIRIKVQAR
jgi:hypothetical protein